MPDLVCLSECCHGDDGLLRGYGTHSNRAPGLFLKFDRATELFLKFDRATLPFLIIDMRHRDPPPLHPPPPNIDLKVNYIDIKLRMKMTLPAKSGSIKAHSVENSGSGTYSQVTYKKRKTKTVPRENESTLILIHYNRLTLHLSYKYHY